MTRFVPLCCHEDLDVHPNPPEGWDRVVVIGFWTTKQVLRKRWPHAAVVGPLRSLRGIDLLIRNLLANPQIRVLVTTGPDHSDGKEVSTTLEALWAGEVFAWSLLGADVRAEGFALGPLFNETTLSGMSIGDSPAALGSLGVMIPEDDRSEPPVLLPPPPPPTVDVLPHGDPGQRVAGETLAEVWPRVLEQAMAFGRIVPTQYGDTREVCDLVSVIRDPQATLDGFMSEFREAPGKDHHAVWIGDDDPEGRHRHTCALCGEIHTTEVVEIPHPLLGLTWSSVQAYYRQIVGLDPPDDRDAYGMRMRGGEQTAPSHMPGNAVRVAGIDQIAAIEGLLGAAWNTRAAFLTPWRADDAGLESGRPCLTGVRFRAVGGCGKPVSDGLLVPTESCDACGREVGEQRTVNHCPVTLSMTLQFRSHDLVSGYPKNLAGACVWLVELAKSEGMVPGAVTCVSGSAHVYARDWQSALDVVAKHPAPIVDFDPRSNFRVYLRPGEPIESTCAGPGQYAGRLCGEPAVALDSWQNQPCCEKHAPGEPSPWTPFDNAWVGSGKKDWMVRRWLALPGGGFAAAVGSGVKGQFDASPSWGVRSPGYPGGWYISGYAASIEEGTKAADAKLADLHRLPLPCASILVAEAIDPEDPNRVLREFVSETGPGPLLLQIARSGLVTGVGHALWLGRETERVWANAGDGRG